MPSAVRITEVTNMGGVIVGPGTPTVLIGNLAASVLGDNHVIPNPTGPIVSPLVIGSATVFIEGKPAFRVGDVCACGGSAVLGFTTVQIG